jgi:enoyl-CoA hydratase/carnithine racemase
MEFEAISVRDDGVSASITLDKPPANVLGLDAIEELDEALEALDEPERKAIVIESANEKLYSGGVEVEDHIGEMLPKMMWGFGELFETMQGLNTPTVAQIEGSALGGGCELAVGCDVAIASAEARFGQPEINLGTFPPIAAAMYPDIVGEKKAFELVMTGDEISAEEAEDIGLVKKVVPPDEVQAETDAIVESLSQKSGLVLGMAKQAFYDAAAESSFEDALEVATEQAIDITSTDEGEEGLNAFMEDRKPEWEY